jgi:N-acetylneuraminic acid mutarotase
VLEQRLRGRTNHAAVAGAGGRVVLIGGSEWAGNHWDVIDRVDVYLPYEHRWKHGRAMLHGRTGVRATALADGRIFVAGGYDGPRLIGTSEIYDPMTDTWRVARSMPTPRGDFSIATLADGRVLVAGGIVGPEARATRTAIYYDALRDTWLPGPQLLSDRILHAQAKLPNGDLLLIGGQHSASNTAERYDARTGSFVYAGTLAVPRMGSAAAPLIDGRAIVTGGLIVTTGPVVFDPTERTELWDPATNEWREVGRVATGRAFARLVSTPEGIYQVSGVAFDEQAQATVERFVWR